ncbi:HalOD1 output domain-containing protein [Natrinema soli]|uniref:HalOD1 output domain-containing protein n=1 Tax=Natrinema soli TaxID=1930624 RepID=A0ABD5SKS6_9EURY|nr:HalOD1 output domain-containing protein [Natrinema soli]
MRREINDTPSNTVIDAIATVQDVDVADLEPLYNALDPDALNAVFQGDSGDTCRVTFSWEGHMITVTNNEVIVSPKGDGSSSGVPHASMSGNEICPHHPQSSDQDSAH